jgi:hypothetical protein
MLFRIQGAANDLGGYGLRWEAQSSIQCGNVRL